MTSAIDEQGPELSRLCRHFYVHRLDLFGSAATGEYDAQKSDMDFVVEFLPEALPTYADAYFGLLEALEQLFGKPVDLVVGSTITNPYLLQSVEETRKPIYEA